MVPSVRHPFYIYGGHDPPASEPGGRLRDQIGVADRRGAYANLVRAGVQHPPDVLRCADSPAHGKRDVDCVRHPLHQFEEDIAPVGGGCDVQKYQFVRPLSIISAGAFHRVARVFEIHKINALYHPPVFYIQARYDSFVRHDINSLRFSIPYDILNIN
jgi:hypothetical protein